MSSQPGPKRHQARPAIGFSLAPSLLALFFILAPGPPRATAAQAPPPLPERISLAIEVLNRIEPATLAQSERLRNTLEQVLDATRGRPEFVALVERFGLQDRQAGLLETAAAHPDAAHGVQAMRLLLEREAGRQRVRAALAEPDATHATHLVRALGNTADQRMTALLQPLVTSTNAPLPTRKAAVQALARTREGASALIRAEEEQILPADLRFTATSALAGARWEDLRDRAAQVLPPPEGQNARPLPPLSELMRMKGDAERGREVFARETSQCAACHKVGDLGVDVGPNLSEIGSKLGKDALYEAILDPSAAVAFNYEAWELTLKSGDEAFGLLVSETPDQVALKDPQGIVTRYDKDNIESRRQMTLSLMPAGLQLTMSTQDLVDLVEFLASLKK